MLSYILLQCSAKSSYSAGIIKPFQVFSRTCSRFSDTFFYDGSAAVFVLDAVCQRSLPRMILFTRSSMEQTLQPARNWAVTWRVSLVSVKEKPPWGRSPQCPLDTELREEPLWLLQPLGMGRVSTEMSPDSQSHGERWHCAQGRDLGRETSSFSLDARQMGRKKWVFLLSLQNREFSQDLHFYLPLPSLSPTVYSLRSQLAVA